MTDHISSNAVREQRDRSNRAIAARDADLVVSFMLQDIIVAVAGGPRLIGRDASRRAFAEQFADAAFRGYVRSTVAVEVQQEPLRATETGRWTGSWHTRTGRQEMQGSYVAEWQHTPMGWMLSAETFTNG